jgi:hypothetical protein
MWACCARDSMKKIKSPWEAIYESFILSWFTRYHQNRKLADRKLSINHDANHHDWWRSALNAKPSMTIRPSINQPHLVTLKVFQSFPARSKVVESAPKKRESVQSGQAHSSPSIHKVCTVCRKKVQCHMLRSIESNKEWGIMHIEFFAFFSHIKFTYVIEIYSNLIIILSATFSSFLFSHFMFFCECINQDEWEKRKQTLEARERTRKALNETFSSFDCVWSRRGARTN